MPRSVAVRGQERAPVWYRTVDEMHQEADVTIERLFDARKPDQDPERLYLAPGFPEPPTKRPYVALNMVMTLDGKTLVDVPGASAQGLGSETDHVLMRRLEAAADAIIVGARTLRPGNVVCAREKWRAVVTRSGDLPMDNRFFTDAPDRAIVFAPASLPSAARHALDPRVSICLVGEDAVDVVEALRLLRVEFGVRHLMLEGGAQLNDAFLRAGLVDEVFLTLAPKIKGGTGLPTVVDGDGLPGREYISLEPLSVYRSDGELYLRYLVTGRRAD